MTDRDDRTILRRPRPGRRGVGTSPSTLSESAPSTEGKPNDGKTRLAVKRATVTRTERPPEERSGRDAYKNYSKGPRIRPGQSEAASKRRSFFIPSFGRARDYDDADDPNPFLDAGGDLLALAARLRAGAKIDTEQLFEATVTQIVELRRELSLKESIEPDIADNASYVICAAVDEAVYVGAGGWGDQETLCARFHRNLTVGEEFFVLLDEAMRRPDKNHHFLELQLVCLRLGYEGVHGTTEGRGNGYLNSLNDDVRDVLRRYLVPRNEPLSAHWQPSDVIGSRLTNRVPWWAILSVGLLATVSTFTYLHWTLSDRSDLIIEQASRLAARDSTVSQVLIGETHLVHQETEIEKSNLAISEILKTDVEAGRVELDEAHGKIRIILQGDPKRNLSMFPSGRDRVNDHFHPLLERVGEALATTSGVVWVTGYTDNVPVKTTRYASNWVLSEERAKAVFNLIGPHIADPNSTRKVEVTGRAHENPRGDNKTKAGRALNRRVEISVIGTL